MAAIPTQSRLLSETAVVKLDLNAGPHSFTYNRTKQVLHVDNGEVGSVTVNILGNAVTTVPVDGLEDQILGAGYDFIIPAGEQRPLQTSEREKYLGDDGNNVVVTVTGASGAVFAWLTTEG